MKAQKNSQNSFPPFGGIALVCVELEPAWSFGSAKFQIDVPMRLRFCESHSQEQAGMSRPGAMLVPLPWENAKLITSG